MHFLKCSYFHRGQNYKNLEVPLETSVGVKQDLNHELLLRPLHISDVNSPQLGEMLMNVGNNYNFDHEINTVFF